MTETAIDNDSIRPIGWLHLESSCATHSLRRSYYPQAHPSQRVFPRVVPVLMCGLSQKKGACNIGRLACFHQGAILQYQYRFRSRNSLISIAEISNVDESLRLAL